MDRVVELGGFAAAARRFDLIAAHFARGQEGWIPSAAAPG